MDAKYSHVMDSVQVTMNVDDWTGVDWLTAGEAAVLAEKLQIAIEQVRGIPFGD